MNTYLKILALALTIVFLTFLNACKRPPETGNVGATTAPDCQVTEPLGPCSGGHSYVDGFCSECGKEFSSEGLEYTLSEDGTYYIVSGMGSCTDAEITVPSVYNKKPVKEIGPYSFDRNDRIRKVNLPEGILSIGENAFDNCKSLVSVNLPDSLKSIGKDAFRGCAVLSGELKIPDKITVIEDGTFSECQNITSVVLPKDLTSIGDEAFKGLSKPREISIPESLTHVGKDAFSGWRLESVNITNFNAWCSIEFESLRSNPMVNTLSDGTSGARLVINGEAATAYIMGDEVKKINNYMFAGCSSLTNVTFSKKLEYIGDGAFYGCTGLQEAILPDSLTYLGKEAFVECTELKIVKLPASLDEIKDHTFASCTALTSIEIPDGISTVGPSVFSGCLKLKSVKIPDSVILIDEYAFSMCISAEAISLGNGKKIMPYAFNGCKALTAMNIPDGVEAISEGTFSYCESLKTLTLPSGIKEIGKRSLNKCNKLIDITYKGTLSEWNTIHKGEEWDKFVVNCTLKCNNATEIINRASVGLEFEINPKANNTVILVGIGTCTDTEIYIPSMIDGRTVVTIDQYAFMNLTSIRRVVIPDTVTSIMDGAFYGCTALTDIMLPSSIKKIDLSVFYFCSALKSIVIPEGVAVIDETAFGNCSSLTNVRLPSTLTNIFSNAFFSCSSLQDIHYNGTIKDFEKVLLESGWFSTVSKGRVICTDGTIDINKAESQYELSMELSKDEKYYVVTGPGSFHGEILEIPATYNGKPVLAIGEKAFTKKNSVITTVILPEGLLYIRDGAFNGSSLKSIYLPSTLKMISKDAFLNTGISSVYSPSIEAWCRIAFASSTSNPCTGNAMLYINGIPLKEVTITDKNVSAFRFIGCQSLEKVVFADGVTTISPNAFYGCANLKDVEFSSTLTSIGADAFRYCTSLKSIVIPESVYTVNESAFANCSALKSIVCHSTSVIFRENSFYGCAGEVELFGAFSISEAKSNSAFLKSLGNAYAVYCRDGEILGFNVSRNSAVALVRTEKESTYTVTGIGECKDICIVLPSEYEKKQITRIADNAFSNCSIMAAYVRDGITTIGKNAFKNCKNTVYVRLPNTLKAIGDGAFDGISDTARIVFDGTIAEWNAISGSFKGVVCTDGTAE